VSITFRKLERSDQTSRVIGKDGDTPFPSQSLQLQRKALTILRIALMVALILGIIAATDISSNESESTMQSIKQYRCGRLHTSGV
jgi:hypothetical protein